MRHGHTIPLRTDRLLLRRFTPDDAPAMFANWTHDDRVTKFLTWPTHPDIETTRTVLGDWLEKYGDEDFYNWAIEFEGEAIGSIGVVNVNENDERGEIGYCIGVKWWGRGIVTEALAEVTGFLFSEMEFHRLQLLHVRENAASGRVMQKCGYRHEGTFRECRKRRDGAFVDLVYYGQLRSDWLEANS